MESGANLQERIALRADGFRHLLQADHVAAQIRIVPEARDNIAPQLHKARRADELRKIRGQQRRVVVAEVGAQPAQPAQQSARLDRKRKQKQQCACGIASGHDGWPDAGPRSDLALPDRKPFESLERGAIGAFFESTPIGFDLGKVIVDRNLDRDVRGLGRSGSGVRCRRVVELGVRLQKDFCRLPHARPLSSQIAPPNIAEELPRNGELNRKIQRSFEMRA
jgi:hypothetical protein